MKFIHVGVSSAFLFVVTAAAFSLQNADQNNLGKWPDGLVPLRRKIDFRHYAWAKPHPRKSLQGNLGAVAKNHTQDGETASASTSPAQSLKLTVADATEYVRTGPNSFRPMTAEESAEVRANLKRKADWITQADRYAERGNLSKARTIYEQQLQEDPKNEAVIMDLADISFREGKIDEMYALTVGGVTQSSSPGLWLRASLALAIKGKVLEGQRRYVGEAFAGPGNSQSLPQGSSPKDIQILSALAIGCSIDGPYKNEPNQAQYLGLVLKLDANNPFAHYYLGQIAFRHRRNAEAANHFAFTVKYGTGFIQDQAKRDFGSASYLAHLDGGKKASVQ